jgi:predicted aspartyl protease
MSRIKKNAWINEKETEITIDTGADISFMDEDLANKLDMVGTGETTSISFADGRTMKADIVKGRVSIPGTCCDAGAEFAVVDNKNQSNNEILLGNDFMEHTGMKIDTTKKEEYNVECHCGKIFEELRSVRK